ncbi:SpoIIE family protein phosphatase [Streptomyces sp. NPDC048248]|uniref:SpoIIE family protein phosphatase n=1 Tax=Streptomyces sp. NPDC048248 TaxID=3365523 RepID=UPI003716AF18
MTRRRAAHGDRPQGPLGGAYTATATVDERGIVTGWSEGAQRLLGHRSDEVVGRPATDLLADEEDADGCTADRRSGGSRRMALRHRDGGRVAAEVLAHRGVADGGGVEWLLVCAGAEEPRSAFVDTLAQWAFAQSPRALAIYDTELRAVRANADMESVVAMTDARMRGRRLTEIMAHPDAEKIEQAMRRVLESGERQFLENRLRTPGEDREHVRAVSLAPLKDPGGRIRGVCFAARDTTEEHVTRQRLLLINEAGSRIGTTLDLARTAQELADVAVPQLADFVTVDLLTFLHRGDEPPSGRLTGPITMRRTGMQSVIGNVEALVGVGDMATYPEFSPPAECVSAGRAAVYQITDHSMARWAAQDPARASMVRDHGLHSAIIVPMQARGITFGMALFARHKSPQPFVEEDMLLAEEITARAAVCIDNARRYTRERTTAVTLQRSLLPQKLARQAALEVASRYLPAVHGAGVGGDWFDVIPLSGERVALVVGDVVGHGIQASASMGRLRTAVHTLADVDLPPEELITHLDDLVTRLSAEEDGADPAAAGVIGAGCLYAVYDPITRRCSLARAGRPQPSVVAPDGTVNILDVPAGPALGLGGLPFEAVEVELPEGSLLALYTDGLLGVHDHADDAEDSADGADAGDEKQGRLDALHTALARPAPTLDALCDSVLDELLPERPEDDIALLLARTRALRDDQVATWDVPSEPSVVARARRLATDQLTAWGLDDAAFVTGLVVSELVTNAIRYGQHPVQLRLIHGSTLIIEVSDASSTAPHLRRARVYDEGGRGLLLVAQLARRWGTRQTPTGKTIWAEQTLPVAEM